jgi:hypothetical protein
MAITDTGSVTSGATIGGSGLSGLGSFGNVMAVAGLASQAIGTYYQVKTAEYQAKSAALDLEFESTMAALNARAAEQDAQLELQSWHREMGRMGLQYRQALSAQRTTTAAAGIQAGVGSAAEVMASGNLAKEMDLITMNSNAMRAANAARTRAVNFRNQSLLTSLSARNIRNSAGLMSPWLSAGTSLLGGAGQVAQQWATSGVRDRRYARG